MRKIDQIRGLHQVTSLAGEAQTNSAFFTKTLGNAPSEENGELRRAGRLPNLLW
jgi:hypothetical protein